MSKMTHSSLQLEQLSQNSVVRRKSIKQGWWSLQTHPASANRRRRSLYKSNQLLIKRKGMGRDGRGGGTKNPTLFNYDCVKPEFMARDLHCKLPAPLRRSDWFTVSYQHKCVILVDRKQRRWRNVGMSVCLSTVLREITPHTLLSVPSQPLGPLLTYILTPWCTILFEKSVVTQLVIQ
jgi:hypothetical protein